MTVFDFYLCGFGLTILAHWWLPEVTFPQALVYSLAWPYWLVKG